MTITAQPGLRERKRAETRSQLEQAAVTIALRDGIEHATIDAISAAANVSPRTFFNYFDSKEDAVLGVRDAEITDEIVRTQVASYNGEPIVESVTALLFDVFAPSLDGGSIQKSRIELVKQHPNLLARYVAQMMRMNKQFVGAIQTLLQSDAEVAARSESEQAALAEMIFATCAGAFRVVVTEWMSADGRISRENLHARTVELVHNLREKL